MRVYPFSCVCWRAGPDGRRLRRNRTAPPSIVGRHFDPFLPYEPEMFVADISPTHVCLLNKFNVIDHHLLVVTRAFEEQDAAINAADFAALWACMAEVDGLAFYNAGKLAGASQRHKHLQDRAAAVGAGQQGASGRSCAGGARTGGGAATAHMAVRPCGGAAGSCLARETPKPQGSGCWRAMRRCYACLT